MKLLGSNSVVCRGMRLCWPPDHAIWVLMALMVVLKLITAARAAAPSYDLAPDVVGPNVYYLLDDETDAPLWVDREGRAWPVIHVPAKHKIFGYRAIPGGLDLDPNEVVADGARIRLSGGGRWIRVARWCCQSQVRIAWGHMLTEVPEVKTELNRIRQENRSYLRLMKYDAADECTPLLFDYPVVHYDPTLSQILWRKYFVQLALDTKDPYDPCWREYHSFWATQVWNFQTRWSKYGLEVSASSEGKFGDLKIDPATGRIVNGTYAELQVIDQEEVAAFLRDYFKAFACPTAEKRDSPSSALSASDPEVTCPKALRSCFRAAFLQRFFPNSAIAQEQLDEHRQCRRLDEIRLSDQGR